MKWIPIAAVALLLVGCAEDQPAPPPRPRPLVAGDCHDFGDAPAVRISDLDDGTRFVVIGKHTDTANMVVVWRHPGATDYEVLRLPPNQPLPAGVKITVEKP